MTVYSIISKLDKAGIKVWVDSGQLKVKAPKGALTKELKAELVEYKAELIQFLPSIETVGKKEDAIPTVARDLDLELSYAQKRMWFLSQLEPNNTAYHIRSALEITGSLDIHALQRALKKLKYRHESLRTTFVETDGIPLQRICKEGAFVLPVEQQGEDDLVVLFSQFVDAPFDLVSGPLFRAKLVQKGHEQYVLMISMHHIISDGWSTAVMISELSALYASCSMNVADTLPEVVLQYVDYAYWQKSWLSGEREDRQLKYWTRQLTQVPVLEVPTDFSRPSVKSTAGGVVSFDIESRLVKQAKTVAQENRASIFMVMLSAFNCLLYRYSGQDDFAVGSPIANRPNAQLEGTVGLFVNTLAMRARFNEGDTFSEHLSSVQSMTLDAFEHQDIPFERIVDVLGVSRDMSHTPIFQVMFVLQNTPGDAKVKLPGVVVEALKIERDTSPMDFTITLVEEKDGTISGELEYCTDFFTSSTAETICRHYVSYLESALANPDQPVSSVDYISESDKHVLLDEWGTSTQVYDDALTIDAWFEQSVNRYPRHIALTEGEDFLTYASLNGRANQVARHLITLGVGKDSFVGISLERSTNVVIAILAVLKAGATYVPIDSSNPVERIEFILHDARVNLVITDSESRKAIPEVNRASETNRTCIEIDKTQIWDHYCADNLTVKSVDATGIAYVIYTSGTTGKPKGVQIPHSNVARLFLATDSAYHFDDKDVWTLFHSYAFDFSVWEIWGALLYGGRLVVVPRMTARSPADFYSLLQKEQVTVLNQTPTAFTHLIKEDEVVSAEAGNHSQLSLRYVIFGGEALDFASLQGWVERHGIQSPKLINMYGITETTVHVSYYEVTHGDLISRRSLIGRPIDDLSLVILDHHLQLVPPGIPGEMYVGGPGVAKGYLHRPELTAERFVSMPARLGGTRMYRTGDLARYVRDEDSSGCIEYLGRIDDQVKIRGFRIELGEIESTLTAFEQVRGSVATFYRSDTGQEYLVAYVHGDVDLKGSDKVGTLDVAELKRFLQERLPEYMVPTQIIVLDQFPLTSNGKVDKKALPAPNFQAVALEGLVGPSSDDEIGILQIWQEVLGIARISVDSNFFEIGGHSLLATQVISRIRKSFNIELSLRLVFESPTIQLLAALVAEARLTQSGVELPSAIVPRPDEVANVLTFAQHRLWFVDQLDQQISAYNLPSALLLTGKLDAQVLENSFRIILDRHSVLCTQYQDEDGVPITTRKDPSTWCLERQDLELMLPAGSTFNEVGGNSFIKSAIEEHAEVLFNLATDWLFVAKLIRCNEDQHVLLINMHHIVSDGWSMGVLLNELKILLNESKILLHEPNKEVNGPTINSASHVQDVSLLPALEVDYEDYAYWQREWLQGENLERLKQYWIDALAGAPAVLRLPTDYPRPEKPTFNGAHLNIDLGVDLTKALYAYCDENGMTPFMVLMAAYQIFLARYTHQDDICVGIPIANRNQYEIEGLIGFFVNGLIIRGKQNGNPTRQAFTETIRDVALGAFAHQDMPMDVLIDALQLSGGGGYSPGAQVAFALQNMPDLEDLSMPGLAVNLLERAHKTAKYELTLLLEERDDCIAGVLEYNTDLFKPETIALMAVHYKNILNQLLSEPDQTIATIDLVLPEDLKSALGCDQEQVQILPFSPNELDVYLDLVREPDSLNNSIGATGLFEQRIDEGLFRESYTELVKQFPLMKAQVITSELPYVDVAYFKIESNRTLEPIIRDFSSREWSDSDIAKLIRETIYHPYDIADGELYKFHLFRLDGERTLMVISVCHLVADGAAMCNSFQDLFKIMQAIDDGVVPAEFNDNLQEYVHSSRQTFDSSDIIQFWQEQSADIEALQFSMPQQQLVSDTSGLEKNELDCAERIEENIVLDKEVFQAIKYYCAENSVHPATYFKTLYTLLLHYYCRPQSHFYFNEVVGGRSRQFLRTFGCLFQSLPTIIPQELMASDKSVVDIFDYFQSYKVKARQYDKLTQFSQGRVLPKGEQSFLYNYYNFISQVKWNGEIENVVPHPPLQDGPVQFIVQEFIDHFRLNFIFNNGLFSSQNYLDRFSYLSQQVVSGTKNLTELDFILPNEKTEVQPVVLESVDIHTIEISKVSELDTVVDRIVQQCVMSPNAIAIKWDSTELTYAELNKRSSQWAGILKEGGVKSGDRVVVCLEPSLELYSALLGVLKAGATYVPVDVDYPADRIRYIIEDSDAHCWITQNCVESKIVESGVNVDFGKLMLIENISSDLARFSEFNSAEYFPSSNDLMYLIYTSGSTGKPKGAGVYHKGVSNLLSWYEDELSITSADSCLLVSSVGFDLTQKNPWVAFCNGAKLVIPTMDQYDPDVIARCLVDDSISWLNCAPSAFYPIVDEGHLEGYPFRSLRHVVLGGEPIRLGFLDQWLTDHTDVTLTNSYGPTECTDVVASYSYAKEDRFANLPIGKAIPNVDIYILNDRNQLLAPGFAGELCIGGEAVGAGYFNKPELTNTAFIPNPFGTGLLYKTGDIVRLIRNTGGLIEYIGRKDFQVKVRGLRIELGEIETALRQQEGVLDAMVLVEEEHIIAYALCASGSSGGSITGNKPKEIETDGGSLRQGLRSFLPDFMLPNYCIVVDKWPLTPNGKIDRGALPAPMTLAGNEFVAPSSDTEIRVAQIWCDVLNVEKVGMLDNFFDLGGHSLLAARVISKLRREFEVEISLRVLFEMNTVNDIAKYIDQLNWAVESQCHGESLGTNEDGADMEEGFL